MNKNIKTTLKVFAVILKWIALAFLCGLFLFPLVWMIMNSLKSQAEVNQQLSSLRTFLPSSDVSTWFVSYKNLFFAFEFFGRSIINSIVYSAITILMVLIVNSFGGYALAKFRFPGSQLLTTILILIIIVPVETSIVPLYTILYRIKLLQANMRVVGYLIPGAASAFYVYMFRQFFMGIPSELDEAARIDGATRLKSFFRIMLPLALPVFATVGIFTFMGSWNDYVWAQLIFSKPEQQPLQVFLQLINSYNPRDISMVMAALTFSTIPIAIVYIFCQKYIVEGVSFTGLK